MAYLGRGGFGARRMIVAALFALVVFVCASSSGVAAQSSALEKARRMKEEAAARTKARLDADKKKNAAKAGAANKARKLDAKPKIPAQEKPKTPPKPKPKPKPKPTPQKKEPVVEPMRRRTADEEEKDDKPAEPTCFDNIKNADETDVDCGGACRSQTRMFLGHKYPRLCNQEQGCKIGADCVSKLCDTKRNKCKPRPVGASYTKEEMKRITHVAFDTLAKQHADGKLRPKNVQAFIESCINPDNQDIDSAEDRAYVDAQVAAFRFREGILDDPNDPYNEPDKALPHGYLTGGKPFKFIFNLAAELHEAAAARAKGKQRRRRDL